MFGRRVVGNKAGAPKKGRDKTKSSFYNSEGIYKTRIAGIKTKACQLWENLRNRTEYLPLRNPSRHGKYADVIVCGEWKDFQVFADWFYSTKSNGHYHEGWTLDKDLLVKGCKVYSPETCVFLPPEVNRALNTRSRARGELPVGLCYGGKNRAFIDMQYGCDDPDYHVWKYFPVDQVAEAFAEYKVAREGNIRNMAITYEGKLDSRAYSALLSYTINIED